MRRCARLLHACRKAPCRAPTRVANLGGGLERLGSLTVIATICPTRIAGEDRPILTAFSRRGGGFGLAVAKDGSACASISGSDGVTSVSTGVALPDGAWARVWMTWDATTSTITVGQQPLVRGQPSGQATVSTSRDGGQILAAGPAVLIGASEADRPTGHVQRSHRAPDVVRPRSRCERDCTSSAR